MTVHAPDTLTHVELIWLEKRIEHWIRFGRDVAELDEASIAAREIAALAREVETLPP